MQSTVRVLDYLARKRAERERERLKREQERRGKMYLRIFLKKGDPAEECTDELGPTVRNWMAAPRMQTSLIEVSAVSLFLSFFLSALFLSYSL